MEIYQDKVRKIEAYVRINPDVNPCDCYDSGLMRNGVCDYPDCYTKVCGYDIWDCEFWDCPEECTVEEMFDDIC